MNKIFVAKSLSDLSDVAEEIVECLTSDDRNPNVVLFYGEMGAGKTTLIREICEAAGVEDTVTSPTFAIVNEYASGQEKPIFHFDFYRIDSLREVYDLGYEEYFFSGDLCLVEWPSKIEEIIDSIELDTPLTRIKIDVNEKEHRIITLNRPSLL